MEDYQSDAINEISGALAKAQGEMQHAGKTTDNPYFKSKYADLPAVMDAARPALAKNGLSVVQITQIDEHGKMTLITQLCHASGQWMRSWYPINPVKNDPQGIGSALTYARRYAYSSIIGVAAAGEDDDGNAASGNPTPSTVEKPKSVFSNAAKRKEFCSNVEKAYDGAITLDDLKLARTQYAAKLMEMRNSGDEYDGMAVDEANRQYDRAKLRIESPEDEFIDGGRKGIEY